MSQSETIQINRHRRRKFRIIGRFFIKRIGLAYCRLVENT